MDGRYWLVPAVCCAPGLALGNEGGAWRLQARGSTEAEEKLGEGRTGYGQQDAHPEVVKRVSPSHVGRPDGETCVCRRLCSCNCRQQGSSLSRRTQWHTWWQVKQGLRCSAMLVWHGWPWWPQGSTGGSAAMAAKHSGCVHLESNCGEQVPKDMHQCMLVRAVGGYGVGARVVLEGQGCAGYCFDPQRFCGSRGAQLYSWGGLNVLLTGPRHPLSTPVFVLVLQAAVIRAWWIGPWC
jgi:hypothetical protein